ncbi:hypothetical protein ABIC83_002511 [Roseateles asaccharophilus]|uniref:hypothetical protein n=1 Tax=Roseateles asaccharophilus TaxID=582607 RepID=UPI003839A2A4
MSMIPRHDPTSYKDIPAAIREGAGDYILDALRALPAGAKPRDLIRFGFASDPSSATGAPRSFAWHCVTAEQPGVLSYFLAANEFEITLKDTCTYKQYSGMGRQDVYTSLLLESMNALEPYSLRMALEMEKDNVDIWRNSHVFGGNQCTLHYWALAAAVENDSEKALHCAQLLRDHGVPLYCDAAPHDAAMHAFMRKKWAPALAEQLQDAMALYHRLGRINLETPVTSSRYSMHARGQRPLVSAIVCNMPETAKTLISLGCEIQVDFRGQQTDLLEIADAVIGNKPELMKAALTEALMRRQVEISIAGIGSTPHAGATASSRSARATL